MVLRVFRNFVSAAQLNEIRVGWVGCEGDGFGEGLNGRWIWQGCEGGYSLDVSSTSRKANYGDLA